MAKLFARLYVPAFRVGVKMQDQYFSFSLKVYDNFNNPLVYIKCFLSQKTTWKHFWSHMELLRHISSYCAIPIMVSAFGFQNVMSHFLPTPPFQPILNFVLHLLPASNTSYCQRVTIPPSEAPHHDTDAQETKEVPFLTNNPQFYNNSKKSQSFLFTCLQHSHSYELPQDFTPILPT